MTIYSLYIYDRHCTCVYYHDWNRSKRPKPSNEGGVLPAVSQIVYPNTMAHKADGIPESTSSSGFNSPRNMLVSSSGVVVAMNENKQTNSPQQTPTASKPATSTLPFDEEAKLVYGVVLSLRNMVKKLTGRDEQFVNFRTSAYKLHLFETPTGYKFVMLSDPKSDSLRFVLRQIYVGPFVEYVVRNPLVKMDSREHGIDNEYFRASVDKLVRGLSVFS